MHQKLVEMSASKEPLFSEIKKIQAEKERQQLKVEKWRMRAEAALEELSASVPGAESLFQKAILKLNRHEQLVDALLPKEKAAFDRLEFSTQETIQLIKSRIEELKIKLDFLGTIKPTTEEGQVDTEEEIQSTLASLKNEEMSLLRQDGFTPESLAEQKAQEAEARLAEQKAKEAASVSVRSDFDQALSGFEERFIAELQMLVSLDIDVSRYSDAIKRYSDAIKRYSERSSKLFDAVRKENMRPFVANYRAAVESEFYNIKEELKPIAYSLAEAKARLEFLKLLDFDAYFEKCLRKDQNYIILCSQPLSEEQWKMFRVL